MKNLIMIFCLFLTFGFSAQSLDRQLIGSAGGSFLATNIDLSFSVGEAVTQTFTTGSVIVTQGFQQSIAGTPPVSTQELSLDNDFSYYPNPVTNALFLKFGNRDSDLDLDIRVFDLKGNLLYQKSEDVKQGFGRTIELDMSQLSMGSYILNIKDKGGAQSRFNIVKIE